MKMSALFLDSSVGGRDDEMGNDVLGSVQLTLVISMCVKHMC